MITSGADSSALIVPLLDENNGIHVLSSGMVSHSNSRKILMISCKIFLSIVPYLNLSVFSDSLESIKLPLIEALENHLEDAGLAATIIDVMCAFCEWV